MSLRTPLLSLPSSSCDLEEVPSSPSPSSRALREASSSLSEKKESSPRSEKKESPPSGEEELPPRCFPFFCCHGNTKWKYLLSPLFFLVFSPALLVVFFFRLHLLFDGTLGAEEDDDLWDVERGVHQREENRCPRESLLFCNGFWTGWLRDTVRFVLCLTFSPWRTLSFLLANYFLFFLVILVVAGSIALPKSLSVTAIFAISAAAVLSLVRGTLLMSTSISQSTSTFLSAWSSERLERGLPPAALLEPMFGSREVTEVSKHAEVPHKVPFFLFLSQSNPDCPTEHMAQAKYLLQARKAAVFADAAAWSVDERLESNKTLFARCSVL